MSVVTRLRAGRSGVRVSGGARDLSRNVQNGCGVHTVGSGEASARKYLTEREADHSPSCIAFVKNGWSCNSISHVCFRGIYVGNFTFFYVYIICDINDVGYVRGSDSSVAECPFLLRTGSVLELRDP